MLNRDPNLSDGDLLYGFPVTHEDKMFEANNGAYYRSVTVTFTHGTQTYTAAFWYNTDFPGGPAWLPTQVGPNGSHDYQDPVNPNYWGQGPGRNFWVCVHGARADPNAAYWNVLCDGECGQPGIAIVMPTDEEVAEHAEQAMRLLQRMKR
jgi:hypothetical protein